MSDVSLTDPADQIEAALARRIVASPNEPRAPQDLRGLHYPFGRWVPETGTAFEVVPGVRWIRFPLPMGGLDHINLWALEDDAGWTLVDTGIALSGAKKAWEALFAGRRESSEESG